MREAIIESWLFFITLAPEFFRLVSFDPSKGEVTNELTILYFWSLQFICVPVSVISKYGMVFSIKLKIIESLLTLYGSWRRRTANQPWLYGSDVERVVGI